MQKVGFGGSCHWCTEAVFQSLNGVLKVEQGWISAAPPNDDFSEAVLVFFDNQKIGLDTLIKIHLNTHSCTSNHPMRAKYRSAVYVFSTEQEQDTIACIHTLQSQFDQNIITEVLQFEGFKLNETKYLDYYKKNKGNSFCEIHIQPKLQVLEQQFSKEVKPKNI